MANPVDSPREEITPGTSNAQVTLAAPGAGRKNRLVSLVIKSDAASTITVQSPAGSNIFKVALAANEGFAFNWLRGLPGAENAAMVINVSAGSYDINYEAVQS